MKKAIKRTVFFAPSVLGADPLNVGAAIDALGGGFDRLHLDIMDGRFVRNLSFGPAMAEALHGKYKDAFLDVHLMLENPDIFIPAFIKAGASQISVHAEVEPQLLHRRLVWIREAGVRAGVVLSPLTPVEQIRPALPFVDEVLLMSVTPGFGGQKFIEETLEKVRDLVRLRAVGGCSWLIEADGGIRLENVGRLAAAGCDVLVIGSALFDSPAPARCLEELKMAVKEALADA